MAFDERESILKRRGWNPEKLTGFRRSVRQEEREKIVLVYRKKTELSEPAKRDIFWSFAIIAFWLVAFLTWRYLF